MRLTTPFPAPNGASAAAPRGTRAASRTASLLAAALFVTALLPLSAGAQAWLPLQGEGSLTVSYAFFDGGDHLLSGNELDGESSRGYVADGDRWFLGDTFGHTVQASVDFGLRDRWALTTSMSYVRNRYDGRAPVATNDDGLYRGTVQDLFVKLRYLVAELPATLVVSAATLIPTRDYDVSGHSSLGRGLSELQLAVQTSRSLESLLPRTYVQVGYLHAFAEEADNGVSTTRGSLNFEIGHVATNRLTVRALGVVHRTFNGKDWITRTATGEVGVHETGSTAFSSQASDADYIRLGGGFSLSLTDRVGWYVVAVSTIDGKNVDDADIIVSGFAWSFLTPWSYDW